MNKLSIQTTDNPRVIKFVANKVFLEGSLEHKLDFIEENNRKS